MTALETYQSFLEGIRKGKTRSFPPELFNPFINKVAREWLNGKVAELQMNSKRIDDIDLLFIKTDGIDYPEIGISDYINGVSVFEFPGIQNTTVNQVPHAEIGEILYPLSFRLIKVIANINGKPVECKYLDSHISLNNKYQKVSEDLVYYELSKNKLRVYATERVSSIALNYVRQPRPFNFNVSYANVKYDPETNDNPETSSTPFEYKDKQVDEIVDDAIRIFLERNTDKRYQTFLNEQKIKAVNN